MKLILKPLKPAILLVIAFVLLSSQKISKGGRDSILDTMYREAKEENTELRAVLEQWEKVREDAQTKKNELYGYLNDCENYYREAKTVAGNINDAKLRESSLLLLTNGENEFKQKAAPVREQIRRLDSLERQMADYEAAFRVSFTLPKIKKLQNGSTVDANAVMKGYNEVIGRSEKLLNNNR